MNTVSRRKSILAGIASGQALMVAGSLVALVTTPLILSHLDAEEYGINIVVQLLILYVATLDFGFAPALMRRLAASEPSTEVLGRHVTSGVVFFGAMSLVSLVVIIPFAPWFITAYGVSPQYASDATLLLRVATVLFAITLMLKPFGALLYARHHQVLSNIMGSAGGLFMPVAIWLFARQGHGILSFVYATIITTGIQVAITIYAVRHVFPDVRPSRQLFSFGDMMETLHYGKLLFIIAVFGLVIVHSDRFLAGLLVSVAAITSLSLTMRIPELLFALAGQITNNLLPNLVELGSRDPAAPAFRARAQDTLRVIALLAIGGGAALLLLVPRFLEVWVGPGYFIGKVALSWFVLFKVLSALTLVNGSILNAGGRIRRMTLVAGIESGLHLLLAWELGKRFGLAGLLAGGALAHIATATIVNSAQVAGLLRFSWWELHGKAILVPLVYFAPPFALLLLQDRHAPITYPGWPGFIAQAALVVAVLGGAAAILIRRDEYHVIRRVAPPLARVLGAKA